MHSCGITVIRLSIHVDPTAAGNRLPSEDGIDLNRSCVSSEDNAAHESVDL